LSGQHGRYVVVVIDQQALDRLGGSIEARREIDRQRLAARKRLPLEAERAELRRVRGATARSTSPS